MHIAKREMRTIPPPTVGSGTNSDKPVSAQIIGVPVCDMTSRLVRDGSTIRNASITRYPCFCFFNASRHSRVRLQVADSRRNDERRKKDRPVSALHVNFLVRDLDTTLPTIVAVPDCGHELWILQFLALVTPRWSW